MYDSQQDVEGSNPWTSWKATRKVNGYGCVQDNIRSRDPVYRNFVLPLDIAYMFGRIFNRFKMALESYPQINRFVENLTEWFEVWATSVQSPTPTFQDPVTSNRQTCKLTIQTLKETIERVHAIIGREHRATESKRVVKKKPALSQAEKTRALLMRLEQGYDPPGDFRPDGPRHDNDYADIAQIRICPTSDELMCPVDPYLPVIAPGTPHHLPVGSMERHLDMQFRLLREDLT